MDRVRFRVICGVFDAGGCDFICPGPLNGSGPTLNYPLQLPQWYVGTWGGAGPTLEEATTWRMMPGIVSGYTWRITQFSK